MFMNWKNFFLLFLVAFPLVTLLCEKSYVVAAEDDVDVDDDTVDIEPDVGEDAGETSVTEDNDEVPTVTKSPDGETTILFLKPKPGLLGPSGSPELHAGKVVEFLVGFTNKGNQGFMLETLDASFRYPMDYSFHIQNFSALAYNRLVKPKEQATLSYSFFTDESFAGRPFGLVVSLGYKDLEGKPYIDAVYNETINIVEIEEGLDGETFFLYIFLAALFVLLLVLGQHLLTSYGGRKPARKAPIERGTSQSDDVDFEWIPKDTLRDIMKKSPKKSPKSPKQRKSAKKSSGSQSD
jgi:translocon-associated protein subunit alpha